VSALAGALAWKRLGVVGLGAFTVPPLLLMLPVRGYVQEARESTERIRKANATLHLSNDQLAMRNRDLADLLESHEGWGCTRTSAPNSSASPSASSARRPAARPGSGSGRGRAARPWAVAGRQVGTLSLVSNGNGFDEARWMRLRDGIVPQLATAIEAAESAA
jgi:hypothetical protein